MSSSSTTALVKSKGAPPKPHVDEQGRWHFFNGDLIAWKVSDDGDSFTSGQIFRAGSPHTGAGRKSTATPPYHIHLYQTETFHCIDGVLCYDIDGKLGKLTKGQTAVIPPYRPHTFWSDPESGKDLVCHITVRGGPNSGFDEVFVRSFYSVLSAATLAGKPPNPLQMFRMLDGADVVLKMPLGLGYVLNWVLGRFLGGYVFGFPTLYKEFDD